MATEAISPPTTPAPKVSRYRSVRRAQEQQQQSAPPLPSAQLPPMPAVPEMPSQKDASVSRSKSRYHRRTTVGTAAQPPIPAPAPAPVPVPAPVQAPAHATTYQPTAPRANTLQSHHAPLPTASPPAVSRSRAVSSPHTSHSAHQRPRTAKQRPDPSPPVTARQQSLKNDDARQLLQKERERQRLLKEKYDAEARAQREAKQAEIDRVEKIRRDEEEAARLKAEAEAAEAEALRRQKEEQKAEQERGKRLRKAEAHRIVQQQEEDARRAEQKAREQKAKLEQERARKAPSTSPPVSPPRHEGFFRRKKDHSMSPEAPKEASKPPRIDFSPPSREPDAIRPGGGGIVPGIDAPTSAVNAGDRRVTVVCGKKRIQLPVTLTTTPLDLIKTAATVLTEPIDVRTAVMQEFFIKVNITRNLRNYEYVRDVMNSWDFDNQNDLTIVHSDEGGIDQDELLAYKVPEDRPEGMSCFINYSSKPGKWAKKYITMRPDGQLVMAKNEKAKEKDHESILTMTDYDIYNVTTQKLAKVKPPKKICFAVKSLQKSNIFADESQYVHFFCTNDRATSIQFYKALQSWRSWYLKHELGEGQRKKVTGSRKVSNAENALFVPTHTRGESVGSHYQLGEFTSLLDLDDFNKKLDAIEVHKPGEFPEDRPLAGLDSRGMHARKKSLRVKQPPPISFNRSAPSLEPTSQGLSRSTSVRRSMDQEEDTFSPGGLLGRGYTQRQAAAQTCEPKQNNPFTEGPSLISGMDGRLAALAANDSGLARKTSTRSSHHKRWSSDLTRSQSKRVPGMPEPLIDLTPQYKPPPQHANKGKGYNPGGAAGPLVESATSIEEAIKVPSSTDWRSRPAGSRAHGAYTGGGHSRTKSLKGRGEPLAAYTQNNHTGAPDDDREAFTGGLLSQAGYSQGYDRVGRGVMDGSKAKGPMIDLANNTNFASGSLLSALPDSGGPVIDRSGK